MNWYQNLQGCISSLTRRVQTLEATDATYTVATLPLPDGLVRRAFVSDSDTSLALGIGEAVNTGGAFFVPVYSDGADWIIG